ncbi:GlcG/HbpS family heme-binding protein [Sphingopyxis sp. 550A]
MKQGQKDEAGRGGGSFAPEALPGEVLEQVLAAARAECERLGVRASVAVVDTAGALAAFLRLPGAFLISTELAIDKAWTAAGFSLSTRGLGDMLAQAEDSVRDGLLRRPRLTVVPGGIPILQGAHCLGAIGVSGGSAQEDEQIAAAGLQQAGTG